MENDENLPIFDGNEFKHVFTSMLDIVISCKTNYYFDYTI